MQGHKRPTCGNAVGALSLWTDESVGRSGVTAWSGSSLTGSGVASIVRERSRVG